MLEAERDASLHAWKPLDPPGLGAQMGRIKWANQVRAALNAAYRRRCQQIGLDALFPNEENPFPWMSEMIDLKKERNFFETRVIEYQTGGALSWD